MCFWKMIWAIAMYCPPGKQTCHHDSRTMQIFQPTIPCTCRNLLQIWVCHSWRAIILPATSLYHVVGKTPSSSLAPHGNRDTPSSLAPKHWISAPAEVPDIRHQFHKCGRRLPAAMGTDPDDCGPFGSPLDGHDIHIAEDWYGTNSPPSRTSSCGFWKDGSWLQNIVEFMILHFMGCCRAILRVFPLYWNCAEIPILSGESPGFPPATNTRQNATETNNAILLIWTTPAQMNIFWILDYGFH